jgi:hypothetical protein
MRTDRNRNANGEYDQKMHQRPASVKHASEQTEYLQSVSTCGLTTTLASCENTVCVYVHGSSASSWFSKKCLGIKYRTPHYNKDKKKKKRVREGDTEKKVAARSYSSVYS